MINIPDRKPVPPSGLNSFQHLGHLPTIYGNLSVLGKDPSMKEIIGIQPFFVKHATRLGKVVFLKYNTLQGLLFFSKLGTVYKSSSLL